MGSTENNQKAILAGIFSSLIFGTSFMATSIALDKTTPEILLAIRFTISVVIMLILIAAGTGKLCLKGKPLGKFILLGLCEPVIYFYTETYGIKFTTSSFSGVMIALIPVSSAILSAVVLHEKLPLGKALWIVCSVAGVVMISASQSSEGVIQAKGIICLLAAIVSASCYALLSRSLSDAFTPFERTFIMMLMGSIAFTVAAALRYGSGFGPAVRDAVCDPGVILPILYLATFSSVLAYSLTNYSLTYLDVSRATIFSNIIPVVSVAAGVLILGEPFSVMYLFAIVLILLGVYKVTTYR